MKYVNNYDQLNIISIFKFLILACLFELVNKRSALFYATII